MKEIRIGIIGTGVIAHEHLKRYKEIPGVQVVAASDIISDKMDRFCKQYEIECQYVDFREMLKRDDIDAVDVCVHNNLHQPLTLAVLHAGKHCYCEKPMAGSYSDAAQMLETAREMGKMLHIQLASLYVPQAHGAKKLIDDGRLGHIYHARSYGFRRRGRPFVDGYAEKEFDSKYWAAGGALYDMGVYHISLMLYLLGLPQVERISGKVYQELEMDEGRKKESGFDVEELGVGFVTFKDGLTMDILESWAIHSQQFPQSMIAGSTGGLSITPHGTIPEPGEALLTYYNELSGYPMSTVVSLADEQYRTRQIDPSLCAYDGSQAHWIAALRGECPLLNTADIALQTMLISEGIYMSSELNREVTADEVISQSVSKAIRKQDTPFGELSYE